MELENKAASPSAPSGDAQDPVMNPSPPFSDFSNVQYYRPSDSEEGDLPEDHDASHGDELAQTSQTDRSQPRGASLTDKTNTTESKKKKKKKNKKDKESQTRQEDAATAPGKPAVSAETEKDSKNPTKEKLTAAEKKKKAKKEKQKAKKSETGQNGKNNEGAAPTQDASAPLAKSEVQDKAPTVEAVADVTPTEDNNTQQTLKGEPQNEVTEEESVAVDETPTDETPTDEKAANETVVDEKATDEKPVEETPAEETPTEEKPTVEKPAEEKPEEKTTIEETPAEEAPIEEKPAEETATEETPAEEAPTEEKPAEEQPAEEKPAEEKPVEEKPAEEVPAEETIAEETPAEEAFTEEKPSEETPAEVTTADEKSADDNDLGEAPKDEPAAKAVAVEETPVEQQPAYEKLVEKSETQTTTTDEPLTEATTAEEQPAANDEAQENIKDGATVGSPATGETPANEKPTDEQLVEEKLVNDDRVQDAAKDESLNEPKEAPSIENTLVEKKPVDDNQTQEFAKDEINDEVNDSVPTKIAAAEDSTIRDSTEEIKEESKEEPEEAPTELIATGDSEIEENPQSEFNDNVTGAGVAEDAKLPENSDAPGGHGHEPDSESPVEVPEAVVADEKSADDNEDVAHETPIEESTTKAEAEKSSNEHITVQESRKDGAENDTPADAAGDEEKLVERNETDDTSDNGLKKEATVETAATNDDSTENAETHEVPLNEFEEESPEQAASADKNPVKDDTVEEPSKDILANESAVEAATDVKSADDTGAHERTENEQRNQADSIPKPGQEQVTAVEPTVHAPENDQMLTGMEVQTPLLDGSTQLEADAVDSSSKVDDQDVPKTQADVAESYKTQAQEQQEESAPETVDIEREGEEKEEPSNTKIADAPEIVETKEETKLAAEMDAETEVAEAPQTGDKENTVSTVNTDNDGNLEDSKKKPEAVIEEEDALHGEQDTGAELSTRDACPVTDDATEAIGSEDCAKTSPGSEDAMLNDGEPQSDLNEGKSASTEVSAAALVENGSDIVANETDNAETAETVEMKNEEAASDSHAVPCETTVSHTEQDLAVVVDKVELEGLQSVNKTSSVEDDNGVAGIALKRESEAHNELALISGETQEPLPSALQEDVDAEKDSLEEHVPAVESYEAKQEDLEHKEGKDSAEDQAADEGGSENPIVEAAKGLTKTDVLAEETSLLSTAAPTTDGGPEHSKNLTDMASIAEPETTADGPDSVAESVEAGAYEEAFESRENKTPEPEKHPALQVTLDEEDKPSEDPKAVEKPGLEEEAEPDHGSKALQDAAETDADEETKAVEALEMVQTTEESEKEESCETPEESSTEEAANAKKRPDEEEKSNIEQGSTENLKTMDSTVVGRASEDRTISDLHEKSEVAEATKTAEKTAAEKGTEGESFLQAEEEFETAQEIEAPEEEEVLEVGNKVEGVEGCKTSETIAVETAPAAAVAADTAENIDAAEEAEAAEVVARSEAEGTSELKGASQLERVPDAEEEPEASTVEMQDGPEEVPQRTNAQEEKEKPSRETPTQEEVLSTAQEEMLQEDLKDEASTTKTAEQPSSLISQESQGKSRSEGIEISQDGKEESAQEQDTEIDSLQDDTVAHEESPVKESETEKDTEIYEEDEVLKAKENSDPKPFISTYQFVKETTAAEDVSEADRTEGDDHSEQEKTVEVDSAKSFQEVQGAAPNSENVQLTKGTVDEDKMTSSAIVGETVLDQTGILGSFPDTPPSPRQVHFADNVEEIVPQSNVEAISQSARQVNRQESMEEPSSENPSQTIIGDQNEKDIETVGDQIIDDTEQITSPITDSDVHTDCTAVESDSPITEPDQDSDAKSDLAQGHGNAQNADSNSKDVHEEISDTYEEKFDLLLTEASLRDEDSEKPDVPTLNEGHDDALRNQIPCDESSQSEIPVAMAIKTIAEESTEPLSVETTAKATPKEKEESEGIMKAQSDSALKDSEATEVTEKKRTIDTGGPEESSADHEPTPGDNSTTDAANAAPNTLENEPAVENNDPRPDEVSADKEYALVGEAEKPMLAESLNDKATLDLTQSVSQASQVSDEGQGSVMEQEEATTEIVGNVAVASIEETDLVDEEPTDPTHGNQGDSERNVEEADGETSNDHESGQTDDQTKEPSDDNSKSLDDYEASQTVDSNDSAAPRKENQFESAISQKDDEVDKGQDGEKVKPTDTSDLYDATTDHEDIVILTREEEPNINPNQITSVSPEAEVSDAPKNSSLDQTHAEEPEPTDFQDNADIVHSEQPDVHALKKASAKEPAAQGDKISAENADTEAENRGVKEDSDEITKVVPGIEEELGETSAKATPEEQDNMKNEGKVATELTPSAEVLVLADQADTANQEHAMVDSEGKDAAIDERAVEELEKDIVTPVVEKKDLVEAMALHAEEPRQTVTPAPISDVVKEAASQEKNAKPARHNADETLPNSEEAKKEDGNMIGKEKKGEQRNSMFLFPFEVPDRTQKTGEETCEYRSGVELYPNHDAGQAMDDSYKPFDTGIPTTSTREATYSTHAVRHHATARPKNLLEHFNSQRAPFVNPTPQPQSQRDQFISQQLSSQVLDNSRAHTPAAMAPDAEMVNEHREHALRHKRKMSIRHAEDTIAAAVVIYATAEVLSPPNSPRMAARGGTPPNLKHALTLDYDEPRHVASENMPTYTERNDEDGENSVTDSFVEDKHREPPSSGSDKGKEPDVERRRRHRHSHHSHHSHHSGRSRDEEPKESRRYSSHATHASHAPTSASHGNQHRRSRADSTGSNQTKTPPRTPKRQEGHERHDSGVAAVVGDSPESPGKKHRTPEEQAARDKRREERRLKTEGSEHHETTRPRSHKENASGEDSERPRHRHGSRRRHSRTEHSKTTASDGREGVIVPDKKSSDVRRSSDITRNGSKPHVRSRRNSVQTSQPSKDTARQDPPKRSRMGSIRRSIDEARARIQQAREDVAAEQARAAEEKRLAPENEARKARHQEREKAKEQKKPGGLKGVFKKLFSSS